MKKLFPALLLSAACSAFAQAPQPSMLDLAEKELSKHPERATEVLARLSAQADSIADHERYRLDWLYRQYGFSLDNVDIDRDQDRPDICLMFNRTVRPQPMQDWASRISLTPAPEQGLQYMGDRLCFTGEWARAYQLKIDGALESDNLVALKNPVEREIATGNRDPMLRFAVQGHVLAVSGDQQIALESTNVRKVNLRLWHFPREGLTNENLRNALANPQSYWADFKNNDWMRERARNVFSGSFEIADNGANAIDKSNVRFADMLGDMPLDANGFYLLNAWVDSEGASTAESYYDEYDEGGGGSQTLVFTLGKAGLSAYRTDEGLWVEARDLASTKVLDKLDIALYAKSGAHIATVKTDAKGMAHFSRAQITGKDGDAPSYLISASDAGITWLNLDDSGFDLADKGLQGDPAHGSLRHWSWIDRGVYRPGEPMHALWVVKNRDLSPFNAPLWLEIDRPDGVTLESRAIQPDESGAYRFDYDFAKDAALGNWRVSLYLGESGDLVARDTVRVDSILPQTLEAKIAPASPVQAGKNAEYVLKADWLYGAPAGGVPFDGSYRIAPASGLPDWQDWQIGRHDEAGSPVVTPLQDVTATGDDGQYALNLPVPQSIGTRPQQLQVDVTLLPQGGRPLSVKSVNPVVRTAPYAALKAEGSDVQVALINDKGELQDGDLGWTLYGLNYQYYWYREGERWQIRENVTRTALESGKVQVSAKAPAQMAVPKASGYHSSLFEVTGKDAQTAASIHLGYRPDGNGTTPDRIRFANSEHKPYRDGDKVTLRLLAPFDGVGSVHLATDGIVDTLPVVFQNGSADISLTWHSGWDSGLWLLASGYNADQSGARNRRAVGLTWLPADTSAYRLNLQGDIPESVEPGQPLTLTFSGEGHVNVAVIDDGLYQLGRATFADPLIAFFGKKRLPLALFDVWGSVIRQLGGDAVKLRSGAGDGEELSSALLDLPDIDMRNFIRYWSGPVAMKDGKASITLDIPEGFNGRLRVMAANYQDKRFGHLEQTLIVRAPLVTELRTPAYLTVKDQGEFLLRLHNTTENPQTVQMHVSGERLHLDNPKRELTLAANESQLVTIPFRVENAGSARLQAVLQSGERSYTLTRDLTIRTATLPRHITRYDVLKGGENRVVKLAARSILDPAARLPWSADMLAEALRSYPYSCSEQLTSRLTILGEDAKRFPEDADKQARFRDPYNTLLNRQHRNGGFSLWYGSEGELWLSAYVGETLLAQGTPPFAADTPQGRLLGYLRNAVLENRDESEFADALDGIAYAHLLLARNGIDLRGALINHSERLPQKLTLSPATLNFALAFVAYGDSERAIALLRRIDPGLDATISNRYSDNLSRDGELLVRLHEWQQLMPDQSQEAHSWEASLVKRIALENRQYLSTQAQSWLLRAARLHPAPDKALTVDGEALTARQRMLKPASVTLANPDAEPQYLAITELHYPSAEESASEGWTLGLRQENFAGKALDPAALPLYENILVHVELARNYSGDGDIILTCPLPAGVHAVSATPDNDPLASFGETEWHQALTLPEMEENRDDRHIAAFRITSDQNVIQHTFVLKAVRAGQWHAPGCQVEDMYRPQHFARGKGQVIHITGK
ncbi:MAG: MG2 domain-containing protein [Cardiobacteriaceae bacterium]|nr:MG2 domain-containing protein [Cardiobacteriaceae bacterium]